MDRAHLKIVFALLLASEAGRAESAEPLERGSRVVDPGAGKGPGDGVYGRFNGDVSVRGGAGVEIDSGSNSGRLLLTSDLMVYQLLGLGLNYRESLSNDDPYARILSAGLNLSPLFLFRFNQSSEWGYAYPDLIFDSLGLFLGPHFSQSRGGTFSDTIGLEAAGILGVPLLGQANGPWLRGRAGVLTRRSDVSGTFFIYLAWEGFLETGLLNVD